MIQSLKLLNLKLDKVDWAGPVRSRFSKGLGRAVPKYFQPLKVELEIARQPPGTDLDLIVEIVKESEEFQTVHSDLQKQVDSAIQRLKFRYQTAIDKETLTDHNSMSSSASSQVNK